MSTLLRATAPLVLCACTACVPGLALAQGKAALVRNIDRPQAQPVHGHCSANACELYTVPPGKRLTITLVSHSATIVGTQVVLAGVSYYGTQANGSSTAYLFVEPGTPVSVGGTSIQQRAQLVDMVLDEGAVLRAGISRFNGDPQMTISFSGYLVDK